MSILFFLIVCTWVVFTAKIDADHLKKKEYIGKHSSRFIARASTGVLVGMFSPVGGLVLALLFWALFDTILNRFRGLPWLYVGSVAETDKFFKNKYKLYLVTKVISLIISITLLFIYGL